MEIRAAFRKFLLQLEDLGIEELILPHETDFKRLLCEKQLLSTGKLSSTGKLNKAVEAKKELSQRLSRIKTIDVAGDQSTVLPPSAKTVSTSDPKREMLKKLYHEVKNCKGCILHASRRKFVFGSGNVNASIMIIGEAPGGEEDLQGLPFVGKAGKLLDDMLRAINLNRDKDTFITNVLKCRPPQNRNPESSEIVSCFPILEAQAQIIQPRAFLVLGRIAAHSMLGRSESISVLRSEDHQYMGKPLIVTYHPAALLRQPGYKRDAWHDLQKLQSILSSEGTDGS